MILKSEPCFRQVNQSSHDWAMQVAIDGAGFAGPSTIVAKAFQTTNFPLMFRPQHEGVVQVGISRMGVNGFG